MGWFIRAARVRGCARDVWPPSGLPGAMVEVAASDSFCEIYPLSHQTLMYVHSYLGDGGGLKVVG